MTNPYTAINEEADAARPRRNSAPPSEPSERDFARVSHRALDYARVSPGAPVWVTCGFAPLDQPRAECKGRVAELGKHGQPADRLRPELGMVWGPWRLTLDRAYQQGKGGHWVESPRVAHRRELGRVELGRKIPAEKRWVRKEHLVSDDNRTPTLPAWVCCRTCNHWRRLDASRLGVGHPDNIAGWDAPEA